MKLKQNRQKIHIKKLFREIYSTSYDAAAMSIGIDVNGCVTLENFKRIISCQIGVIAVETKNKTVYIYGDNLVMADCNRYSATVFGNVSKVEIFSKGAEDESPIQS